ncbi:MAG: phenylalanine--tRNA ligase subunit beta [Jiangellales bacterium]
MRVPLSWLREYVALPDDLTPRALGDRLLAAGLEVETVETVDVSGPLVLGRVLDLAVEEHSNGKSIRWCQVDVGGHEPRGIVCGAHNFDIGDLVVVALPGAVLPGGFAISARRTYGHVSDGMICSVRELGIGDEHDGILVLRAQDLVDVHGAPSRLAQDPGADARALLGLPDAVLDIAVTPDRGYCLSVRGVARETATALGVAFIDPAAPNRLGPGAATPTDRDPWPVMVDDPTGCDRFAVRVARDLDPTRPAPLWLRTRLHLAGMRPISLAVDVTNHVMLELGQPIHGYDGDRLTGPLGVRRAQAGESLQTLDGKRRDLDPDDLVITDDTGAIGVAGVMGGASTEMSGQTTHVVVEAAHFDAVTIARAARRHKLPSEASRRFERGVDPDLPAVAAGLVVQMLADLGGATVHPALTDVDLRAERTPINLPVGDPARIAGRPYSDAEVVGLLTDVGCDVAGPDADGVLAVTAPTWRPDLTDPVDLVEEVVRLAGYDTLPATVPTGPASRGLTRAQLQEQSITRAIAHLGGIQVANYPFVGDAVLDAMQVPADAPERMRVRLANPISDEEPYLRAALLPGLLQALRRNIGRGLTDLALFEIGRVFLPRPGQTIATPRLPVDRRPTDEELATLDAGLPDQPRRLAVVIAGKTERDSWFGPGRESGWLDAIGAARGAARMIDAPLAVRSTQRMPWHPGRCAELSVQGEVIGFAGELHPRVLAALDLPPRVGAMEIDIERLAAYANPIVAAPTVSTFPPAREDLAFVVADDVPAADLADALTAAAGDLLEQLRLFDLYTGPQVGEGRKSLAYSVTLRAPDRTLTVDELGEVRAAMVASAAQRVGAELRSG